MIDKKISKFNPDELDIKVNEETKKGLNGLREFIKYWEDDLKPFGRKCINIGLPLYIELSQVSSDTENFVKNNNIVGIKGDNGEIKYQYADGKPVSDADDKVLTAFQKHGDKIFEESKKLGIVDFFAIHNISEMMYAVDDAINNFKNPATYMIKIYSVFTDDGYYESFFKGKTHIEEAENYKTLAQKIEHAFGILKNVK